MATVKIIRKNATKNKVAENTLDSRIADPEAYRILQNTRRSISKSAGTDPDRLFTINRYVFSRLQLDERKPHKKLKTALYKANNKCCGCGKRIKELKDVHIHRIDSRKAYRLENCQLMHPNCHQRPRSSGGDLRSLEAELFVQHSERMPPMPPRNRGTYI